MPTIIFRTPNFEDAAIVVSGDGLITMIPVIPYEADDEIKIEGSVEVFDGETISVCEGVDEVGTITSSGVFVRTFTASGAGEFSLYCPATSNHKFGFIAISKT